MSRKTKAAEFSDVTYDVHVTGRHVLVTDAMKAYAIEKVSKIDRLNQRVIDVNVIMDIQRGQHRVDIILIVDNVKIKSQACSNDMYYSIDRAVEKMTEQLKKYKSRVQDHHSITHEQAIDMNVNIYGPIEDALAEINDEIDSQNRERDERAFSTHQIVSSETRPLKTLTNQEALFKLDLSGDTFMIFRSEEDQKLKVIYLRNDGNFGIIEPE